MQIFVLCSISISNAAFQYLTNSFKVNQGIHRLHLVGKNFRMADHMADSLKVNTTLVAVHLRHFGSMDNECAKSLANAIIVIYMVEQIPQYRKCRQLVASVISS